MVAEMGTPLHSYPYGKKNVFNMDKTGSAMGNTLVWKAEPAQSEWLISFECISTAGRLLPTLVIFKGTTAFNDTWLPMGMSREKIELQGWAWWASNAGWTNHTLGLHWLKEVFKTSITTPNGKRRILIVDGHSSQITPECIAFCIAHAMGLMVLLVHLLHVTQSLDVTEFEALKRALSKEMDRMNPVERLQKAERALMLVRA